MLSGILLDQMVQIALLTSPGMAPILNQELSLRGIGFSAQGTTLLRNHDLILGEIEPKQVKSLFKMQTVEDIFAVVSKNSQLKTKADLKKLIPRGFKDRILSSLTYHSGKSRKAETTRFAVFVKQDRDHEIYRKDIARTISDAIEGSFSRWKLREPADVELWSFLTEVQVVTGLRLTTKDFRKRNYRAEERVGSLRPNIAAGLVILAAPSPDDLVLDPMCGSGTILFELASFGVKKVIGCDIDSKAIDLVQESAKSREQIELYNFDSTQEDSLSEFYGRINKIICNLPFGKQHGDEAKLEGLYAAALLRWRNLLADKGEMILLTPHSKMLQRVVKKEKLKLKELHRIRLKGQLCSIIRVWD